MVWTTFVGGWKGIGVVLLQERRSDGIVCGVVWIVVTGRLLKVVVEHLGVASDAERFVVARSLIQRQGPTGEEFDEPSTVDFPVAPVLGAGLVPQADQGEKP